MIHIATVHWNTARWIAPQGTYLRRHLKSDFRIYAWLNNIPDAPTGSFYFSTSEPIAPHAIKLNLLADIISASSAREDDILIFIDGDAFPIADLDALLSDKLAVSKMVAVQRFENNGDIQPHPCFCATTVGFWRRIKGDWKEGYQWKNKNSEGVTDVGGNLLKILNELEVPWTPLRRSNRIDLHPVFYGIYDHTIYHHGAGFRKGVSRAVMANLQLKPRNNLLAKLVPSYRRKLWKQNERAQAKALEQLVAKNDELSEHIFKKILADPQFYNEFM